jgi:hypothetical protein
VTYEGLIAAEWRSLGFDVVDETLSTSLLYTVGGIGTMASVTEATTLSAFSYSGLIRSSTTEVFLTCARLNALQSALV